jgi:hypothetical protein
MALNDGVYFDKWADDGGTMVVKFWSALMQGGFAEMNWMVLRVWTGVVE